MKLFETKKATSITRQTLIGVIAKNFPINHGNCFSVLCDDDTEYRIVNFCVENLEHCISQGITWPIKIKPISDKYAVIHDERIPDNYYYNTFCDICCPDSLLTITQKLEIERKIEREEITYSNNGKYKIQYLSKEPKL